MEALQIALDSVMSFGVNIFRTFEVRHLIDIGILSFAIFKLLWMLRSTSSGRMFHGIIILLVGLWLSSTLRLYALSYLLSNALEWGLVVIVVLFQPEIRRFLERMGSSRLGISMFVHTEAQLPELEEAIFQTATAVRFFWGADEVEGVEKANTKYEKKWAEILSYNESENDSQKKDGKTYTGALIVFERNDLLDEEIKSGSGLDCRVTSELLQNIFWNKAPLHDGAVIVRGGRIVAAGAVLPLSTNGNLNRQLGTRHRAGLGISEKSDAIVVVVSEENGSISMAKEGSLQCHLTPERLECLLKNELLTSEKEEKKSSAISGLFHKGKKEEGDT